MGAPEEVIGKRALVELSRMLERFALAAPPDEPLVVVAMFQKLAYFEQARAAYRDIAARGTVTVIGLAEDTPPPVPPGVRHALFPAGSDLSREWSVTVLGPRGGATLVATDLEQVDPVARTLEQGRMFRAAWSFRRKEAYTQLVRLRDALRLPADVLDRIDGVLRVVRDAPEPPNQEWRIAPMRYLAERVADLQRERTTTLMELETVKEDGSERDPRTGLYTEQFLARWTRNLAPGTLSIGLALVHVYGIVELRAKYGLRAELAALRGVSGCVQDLLTPVDRVVKLGREDFLVVLPSWPPERVLWFCEEVCTRVGALDQEYPFVPLPGVAAATVTRNRPLPVEQLRQQVLRSGGPSGPVSVLSS